MFWFLIWVRLRDRWRFSFGLHLDVFLYRLWIFIFRIWFRDGCGFSFGLHLDVFLYRLWLFILGIRLRDWCLFSIRIRFKLLLGWLRFFFFKITRSHFFHSFNLLFGGLLFFWIRISYKRRYYFLYQLFLGLGIFNIWFCRGWSIFLWWILLGLSFLLCCGKLFLRFRTLINSFFVCDFFSFYRLFFSTIPDLFFLRLRRYLFSCICLFL